MQGSWSNDDNGMLEAMVESFRRVDNKLGPTSKTFDNTTTNEVIDINDIS
jgi:hypothetical protein